jgi:hypothetical protein
MVTDDPAVGQANGDDGIVLLPVQGHEAIAGGAERRLRVVGSAVGHTGQVDDLPRARLPGALRWGRLLFSWR